jgi:predicted dehydrogenase
VTAPPALRSAVVGVGHLGRFHARVHAELPDLDLRYVVDVDPRRARDAARQHGGEPRTDPRDILADVDLVSIVTPTTTHHAVARDFLDAGVSVLLEKPMTATVEQADELIRLARERGARLQVGHIERFNPAYRAVRDLLRYPLFIECHRLGPYPFRSTDVSVVLDLMIHDLDLILDLAGGPPDSLEAVGVPILSKGTDIANARLRFPAADGPGCIANVTASRVSPKPLRRLRVFQPDAYVSMDFLAKKVWTFKPRGRLEPADVARLADLPPDQAFGELLDVQPMDIEPADALLEELRAFAAAVRGDAPVPVPGEQGRRALALAADIDADIARRLARHRPDPD